MSQIYYTTFSVVCKQFFCFLNKKCAAEATHKKRSSIAATQSFSTIPCISKKHKKRSDIFIIR